MRASGDSPVATVVGATALAIPKMVQMLVVDPRVVADVTGSPTLVGKSQADSPAAAALRAVALIYGIPGALFLGHSQRWARFTGHRGFASCRIRAACQEALLYHAAMRAPAQGAVVGVCEVAA